MSYARLKSTEKRLNKLGDLCVKAYQDQMTDMIMRSVARKLEPKILQEFR